MSPKAAVQLYNHHPPSTHGASWAEKTPVAWLGLDMSHFVRLKFTLLETLDGNMTPKAKNP